MNPFRHAMMAIAALALAACAVEPPERASLPRDFGDGVTRPIRSAVSVASSSFGHPSTLAGQPAQAARALALMEYITVELPQDQLMTRRLDGLTELELLAARREWRAALGIAPDAPAQRVVDGLFAGAFAISAGNPAGVSEAFSPPVFQAGGATAERLAALPPLPRTRRAAEMARVAMDPLRDRGNDRSSGGVFP